MSNTLLVGSTELPVDKEGYLENLSDWNENVANVLATTVNISLNEQHWQIINLLRAFHKETGLSPAMRVLVRLVKKELGVEKGNSIYLLTLFPESPAKLACKIAGLPRPTNCL